MNKKGVILTSTIDHDRVVTSMFRSLLTRATGIIPADIIDRDLGRLRRRDLDLESISFAQALLSRANAMGHIPRDSYVLLYQLTSLTKKLALPDKVRECKLAGWNKFLAGEEGCSLVNRTLAVRQGFDFDLFDRVSTIIESILGRFQDDILEDEVEFGPGTSVSPNNRPYSESAQFFKLSDPLYVPVKASRHLAVLVGSHPTWVRNLGNHYGIPWNVGDTYVAYTHKVLKRHLRVVSNDFPQKIAFVPKSSVEYRTIGIELNGLVPLQKLVGNAIRRKLKKVGIDLDTQSRNQHLARMAKTFGLSTIDLANASSSISYDVIKAVFPSDWFAVLDSFRSSHGHCPLTSSTVEYSLFSSMGNGYTFEMETLLFYAIVRAIAERKNMSNLEIARSVSVYGDDIICPRSIASDVVYALSLFGFSTNLDKSYLDGYFFESCGKDFYDGTDVRPFFLRRKVTTLRDLLFLLNQLLEFTLNRECPIYSSMYIAVFKLLDDVSQVPLGPLHFYQKEKHSWDSDDPESVLRVPLFIAKRSKSVSFDTRLFAWRYKKFIRVAHLHPLNSSRCRAVNSARYLTLLKGQRRGDIIVTGRSNDRLVTSVTSQWDGTMDASQFRRIENLFLYLSELRCLQ